MHDDDVIDTTTSGEYRVRLISDNDPEEPYDEGASPIIRIDYYPLGARAEQVNSTSYNALHEGVLEAANRWGHSERFRRYCRAFHGVTAFRAFGPNRVTDYTYVTLDPADWREKVGVPAGFVSLDEWIAYLEGDVWGWIVQQRETLESVWRNAAGEVTFARESEDWTEVDSCFGYYGREYAEEAALEALDSYR